MKIQGSDGKLLDATFSVQTVDGARTILLESRGGKKNAPNERNRHYAQGLELLLWRLQALRATITSVLVESAETAKLSPESRQLLLKGRDWPVVLEDEVNIPGLRKALSAAQGKVGRVAGAKGAGNPTRKIRIYLDLSGSPFHADDEFASFLYNGKATAVGITAGMVAGETAVAEIEGAFDVGNVDDARRKTSRAIILRQGQPAFRKALLKAYGGRCAISGCDAEPALEAAHILPYRGEHTHHVQNGLLLRADLHTLFDRGLIGIDTKKNVVVTSDSLKGTVYAQFEGTPVRLPEQIGDMPSTEALDLQRHGLATGKD